MFDESESEPLTEPDTPNHTKFYGSDDSANYDGDDRLDGSESFDEYYNRLATLNCGVYNGKWADKGKLRDADNLGLFDSIASSLELTDHQKTVARRQFSDLNLAELSTPTGIDGALVAVMVSAAVCRADGRFYHPNKSRHTNDSLFVELVDELDYRQRTVHKCYQRVLNRVTL